MINFTVGPVQSSEEICRIGAEQVPYFRTSEFSSLMKENEKLILQFAKADEKSKAIFLTGSGTAAMEATVINLLTSKDKVLIINGGSFGQRFVNICSVHNIPYTEIKLERGKDISEDQLKEYEGKNYTALLVNVHETSTGVHYDINLISEFCKRNNLLFIVDAISSFLADELDVSKLQIDVMITSSQKALACPPGISILVISEKAEKLIYENDPHSLYLDLKDALKNAERGQTPFTPAVGILIQINARLKEIEHKGGIEKEIEKTAELAEDFRKKIKGLPFEIESDSLSNAVTPIHPITNSAYKIFEILKDEYGIWVCPNGGDMSDYMFRVGHIGNLTKEDNSKLVDAFLDLQKRGII
ncbi:MAG: aminotransferase class V-fold PLP-dependent enzyme [Lachnospiraceae bacterium]|nr:aminotransferase class V-fold PLP-dependent enzyme [Lachnospiraceae bacterium]